MGEIKDSFLSVRHEPWFYSVLLLSLVPLFSDYVSFPLIFGSLFFAWQDAKRRGKRLSFGKIGLLMAAYLAYMAVSLFYTRDFSGSFWSLMMWVAVFAVYLVAATVLVNRRRLRTAILCVTTVTGMVGGIAVIQYFLREVCCLSIDGRLWQSVDQVVYAILRLPLNGDTFGDRVSGPFNNPNLLAAYLVLTIPFSIAFVLTGTRSKPKAAARIALILATYALGFSFSRGGYLALMVVAAILFLMYVRKKTVMALLTVLYVVLLIPPTIGNRLITVIPNSMQQSAVSVKDKDDTPPASLSEALDEFGTEMKNEYKNDDSVSMRFRIWKQVLLKGLKHPLFGSGVGVQTTQNTLEAAGLPYKHAHNLLLEIFAEGGLISVGFFVAVLFVMLKRGWKLLRYKEDTEATLLGFAILGSCIALCIHGVFDFLLLTPRLIGICMLLMGITEAAARLYLKVSVPEPYNLRRDLRHSKWTAAAYDY